MEMTLGSRLRHAWNTFLSRDPLSYRYSFGPSYSYRPDRPIFSRGNERSIVTSVYNRIALDVSSMTIQHVRLDENDRFKEVIESGLNNCLNLEANIDQTGRAFVQDIVMSMLDEGCVAIVPVDTTFNPKETGSFDISTMRTGKIFEWYPQHVKVRVYNDRKGEKEDILVPKSTVAIVENPFYSVMNEPNSTMQRLIRKLNLLDAIDEQSGSGKLNLIIQLPYVIKTAARRQQAEERRKDIEEQLSGSKYGVAYTDGTEHVVQLNRPVDNNLMSQIEYLTSMLYSQLGLTQGIMDGSADEKTMQNYYTRTIEPILSAIVDEMKRKFLTKTARSQKQSILFFRDPFKLVPVGEIAEISDKMTRNEIMTSNECQRQFEIVRKRRRNFVIFWRRGVTNSSVSLLKKCVYNLLLLAHKFLALLQAVRLTLDVDNGAVMQDTIQDGGGDGDVGKDLVPLGESLVGGKNGGRFLIPSGNELEEQVCPLDVHGKVADLINDKHPIFSQNLELVRQAVLKMCLLELLNELVAVDIVGRETVLCRHKTQGRGQMGLAYTGRPEEYYIFSVFQKAHGGQFVNLALIYGGLEGKIEVVQGLLDREPGHLDLFLIGPSPLGFGFFREDMVQNIHNVEILRHRPFQIIVQDFQGVLHLEAFQVFPQPVHGKFTHTAPRHIWTNRRASRENLSLCPVPAEHFPHPSSVSA